MAFILIEKLKSRKINSCQSFYKALFIYNFNWHGKALFWFSCPKHSNVHILIIFDIMTLCIILIIFSITKKIVPLKLLYPSLYLWLYYFCTLLISLQIILCHLFYLIFIFHLYFSYSIYPYNLSTSYVHRIPVEVPGDSCKVGIRELQPQERNLFSFLSLPFSIP